jgi:hypothetical protein
MDENKIKHLEFIQNIITRMNSNSFQLKGLVITIVSALLAVYASNKNQEFILIAIVPSVLFWFLDAYYLQQERKFRGLYNDVSGVSENPKNIKIFEMRPDKYAGGKYHYLRVFFSPTIWPMYSVLVIGLMLTYKFIICTNG